MSKNSQCAECKRLRQELEHLVRAVDATLTAFDQTWGEKAAAQLVAMDETKRKVENLERGRKLGLVVNSLQVMYERALRYGLGRDTPLKAKADIPPTAEPEKN